jgi:phosphate:Na+ symporter
MEIILLVLGGLGLFLYAVSSLSDTLRDILGDRTKDILKKCTGNLFTAILTGLVATTILDSSSAVIILAIVMINAKVLTFRQALGIVMGANIGTTFSSQLIAFDIGKFSPIPIFIGLILTVISKSKSISQTAKVLLYFGILFFGLYTMERAVEPLRDDVRFNGWMTALENPWKGAATGALVTLIIQSSSATVGMVITLAKKGLITLGASLAVMLGAELGTCADTLLATIKSNRQALKTGLFHLAFNFFTIILGLMLFPFFVKFVQWVSGNAQLERMVANGHMLFNILGVLAFIPLISTIERLLNKWLPDKLYVSNEKEEELTPKLSA